MAEIERTLEGVVDELANLLQGAALSEAVDDLVMAWRHGDTAALETGLLDSMGEQEALVAGLVVWFSRLDQEAMETQSSILANFLIFTVIVGWLAKGLIGRSLISWGESLVDRMPIVRSVYSGVKQIAETVFAQTDAVMGKHINDLLFCERR